MLDLVNDLYRFQLPVSLEKLHSLFPMLTSHAVTCLTSKKESIHSNCVSTSKKRRGTTGDQGSNFLVLDRTLGIQLTAVWMNQHRTISS